jgi:polygalacturonase
MKWIVVFSVTAVSAAGADVRDFGAKGDGRADDAPAFERAAAAGPLWLPKGDYRLARTVVLRADRGPVGVRADGGATVWMEGSGPAFRIVGGHTGTADPRTLASVTAERERMPLLDGVVIAGRHPEADGVLLEGTVFATLTRLLIRRVRHAVLLTGRNRNVIVSACHLYDNSGAGLLLDKLNLHQVNVTGCHISYNRGGGIVVRDSEIRNLQIAGCDLEANMAADGPPAANLLVDTRAGSVREGALTGSTLQHDGKVASGANVRMIGAGPDAPHQAGFFSIADNVLSDAAINIHLRHVRGVNITGNTFAQGYTHHLLAEDSSDLTLGPNTLDQNPDYDQGAPRNVVAFIDSRDSSIHGLHINRARGPEASLLLRRCRRFHVTGTTILDSDGAGIWIDRSEWVRVSGSLIHNVRAPARQAIRVTGGRHVVVEGVLSGGAQASSR